MPRIRQNAERDAMKDFQAEVNAQCGRYGYKSQRSLGDALGVCQATAGNYLKNPECIQFGTLRAMVKLLRLDPLVILKALGYSAKDIQKTERRYRMTLKELSKCYEEAAAPLRQRLKELREQLKTADDPEEIWRLKRRIADLTPMLTEMNALAELTANYYEGWYYRDERFSVSNAIRFGFGKKGQTETCLAEYHTERIDGSPEGYGHRHFDRGQETRAVRSGTRGKQVHCEPDASQSAGQNSQDNPVPISIDDALVDSLFGENPKRNRRIT